MRSSLPFAFLPCALLLLTVNSVKAFTVKIGPTRRLMNTKSPSTTTTTTTTTTSLNLFFGQDKPPVLVLEEEQREKLSALGYSEAEIERMFMEQELGTGNDNNRDNKIDEAGVRVDSVEIDPVTLTAIGFLAIALNFFVFANMGDGGISGTIATFMNTYGD